MNDPRSGRRINRRQFLIGSAAASAGVLLAGSDPRAIAASTQFPQPASAAEAAASTQSTAPTGPASAATPVEVYPISEEVFTTVERAIVPVPVPSTSPEIYPRQVALYERYGYGRWEEGPGVPIKKHLDLMPAEYSGESATNSTKLLSFFTISDVHIDDKESPAVTKYLGYEGGTSSGYSANCLYTTHVLDAAVRTINAMHEGSPFDFGMVLGDDANNAQYNELRWFIDVMDGKVITPSSGAHLGADTIDYQKPYRAAGLNTSIPWYQVVGNHDQHWSGAGAMDDRLRKALVGERVLDLGSLLTNGGNTNSRGFYVGVIDGTTPYGDVVAVGPIDEFASPPKVAADPDRRSLNTSDSSTRDWMGEFFNSSSSPNGHGFTPANLDDDFACYSFEPKAGQPIKVISLDDTGKAMDDPPRGHYASASLDQERYDWLVSELDKGQAEGKLMIVATHIPIGLRKADGSLGATFSPASEITDSALIAKLHSYPNLILWISGHAHRNVITAQLSPDPKRPELGFWEVETASLRDFPQQFRRFDIVRNSDNTISIITTCESAAVAPGSPAAKSRSYAVATQQIFRNPVPGAPSGVFNAELVAPLSSDMQEKIAELS